MKISSSNYFPEGFRVPHVNATINYCGEIHGRARFDLLDASRTNLVFEPHVTRIRDARPTADRFTLDTHGFMLATHASTWATRPELIDENLVSRADDEGVNRLYNQEVAAAIKAITGARDMLGQSKGLLVRIGERAERRTWAGLARFAHMDFTAKSAHDFLRWTLAATGTHVAPYSRFVIYQTWRAISPPPQDNLLALCDGRSVLPEDLVVFDSVLGPEDIPGNKFESRLCKYNSTHHWYYFSKMQAEELLIFKGFDSAAPEARNALHTAFDDPSAPSNATPRSSVESRFFAFFD